MFSKEFLYPTKNTNFKIIGTSLLMIAEAFPGENNNTQPFSVWRTQDF